MKDLIIGENNITATKTIGFEKAGLKTDNCEIVYEMGTNFKSWNPGRNINAISKFTKGNNYVSKLTKPVALDMEEPDKPAKNKSKKTA